jgi:hypothetical protein
MPLSTLEVKNSNDLRPHLEEILSCIKSLHVTLGAAMVDIAAIRKTMFENPHNIKIYQRHLELAIATAKPLVDEAMLSYDFLMQEISNSQHWAN